MLAKVDILSAQVNFSFGISWSHQDVQFHIALYFQVAILYHNIPYPTSLYYTITY